MNELEAWLKVLPSLVMLAAGLVLLEIAVRARRREFKARKELEEARAAKEIMDKIVYVLDHAPEGSVVCIMKGDYDGKVKIKGPHPASFYRDPTRK